jgi:nucleotide-binding universal stress UspA family protein
MRVLVATDGSAHASAAVQWMRHLPFPPDREVMVITVIEPTEARWPGMPDSGRDGAEARIAGARRLADDTASQLLTGRTATGRVVEGDAQREIIAAARDWGADIVVVGARGRGAVKGLLLGSVSLGVVRHAACPVLVCKGSPREVRTVTFALDRSAHARRAFDWFASLPVTSSARFRLVAVADSAAASGTIRRAELAQELDAMARIARARVPDVEVTLTTGAPAVRIVREARRHGSDLLVVGARGVGGARRLLLGSVSESVLRRADCPVLVVRRGAAHGAV